MWRCPTLPVRPRTSTIGSAGLNFRVRYENGWIPCDIITTMAKCVLAYVFYSNAHSQLHPKIWSSNTLICPFLLTLLSSQSTKLLVCDQALDLLVSVNSMHCCTYIPDLSTLSSSRSLTVFLHGISYLEVGFTLRCFQRLSTPYFDTRQCCWRNNRSTIGTFIPVLSY